jgi:hypothetical protein
LEKKVEDIQKKVSEAINYRGFQELWNRYDQDFDIWRVKPHPFESVNRPERLAVNITNNRGRSLSDKCQGYLTRSDMQIRVKPPRSLVSLQASQLASKIERMHHFGFDKADKLLRLRLQANLLSQESWFANNTGTIAVRVLVYEEDGEIVWDYLPLNSRHLVYEVGDRGMSWVAYRTFRSKASIEEEYGEEKAKNIPETTHKGVALWEYYDKKVHAVFTGNSGDNLGEVLIDPEPHNLPRPPISLIVISTNPDIVTEDGLQLEYRGESIYAPNRLQYKQSDEMASILATIGKTRALEPLVHLYDPNIRGEDGKPIKITEKLYYPGAVANLPNTHKFVELPSKDVPPSLQVAYANLLRDEQMASLATLEYGVDQPPHTGIALAQLREDKNKLVLPRLQGVEASYTDICEMANEQIKAQNLTVQTKVALKDMYDTEEITPQDLEDAKDFYMKVSFVLMHPYEDLETLQLIDMGRRLGIFSLDHAMEEIAKIPDPEAEKTKLDIERAESQIPELANWRAFMGLIRQGRFAEAQMLNQYTQLANEERRTQIAELEHGVRTPAGPQQGPQAPQAPVPA